MYYDIVYGYDGYCCLALSDVDSQYAIEYQIWLLDISNGFTQFPNWNDISDLYFYFLEKFVEEKPEYNFPINYNQLPNALLNLNDC